jgi:spermidine synthase
VTLAQSVGPVGGYLELILSRNQFVLLTDGALYSDGKRYRPAVTICDQLASDLPSIRSVLVLGVGLGSIVRVMQSRGVHPEFTLVEQDRTVLRWAMETLTWRNAKQTERLEPICQDAEAFMAENRRTFDLIFVDVFKGRKVPSFVTSRAFLLRCRDSLASGGRLALNYLVDDEHKWEKVWQLLEDVFSSGQVLGFRDNRIFIGCGTKPGSSGVPRQG